MIKEKDTTFRKKLISLILPMTLQNLVFALVPISDAVMLLFLSQEAMTSVSLASQVPFVLSLFAYSITAGGSILAAQYWGKGDTESIEKIFGYMFFLSLPIMAVFFMCSMFIPEGVIRIFTDVPELIDGAIPYLRYASFSYIFMNLCKG